MLTVILTGAPASTSNGCAFTIELAHGHQKRQQHGAHAQGEADMQGNLKLETS